MHSIFYRFLPSERPKSSLYVNVYEVIKIRLGIHHPRRTTLLNIFHLCIMQTLVLRLSCPAQTTAVDDAVEILGTDSQKTD